MWNKSKYILVATAIVAISLMQSHTAKAVSIYDDAYQSIDSVKATKSNYYGTTCSAQDLTTTWQSYVLDDTKWHSGDTVNMTSARDSLRVALLNGSGWAVSQARELQGGDPTKYKDYVIISWNEDPAVEVQFAFDGHSSSVFYGDHYVVLTNNPFNGSDCTVYGYAYGEGGAQISTDTGTRRNLLANAPVDYPINYEGNSIVSDLQGGVITGNVQCANTNNVISAIQVNVQSGTDGNAAITDDGMGGKNYQFYLWGGTPYSLIVVCDGDPFYGPTVNTDLYDHYDWVCATTGGQNVCAAS